VAALVLPGIIAGIQLHPYEYIYYNSFIGGERGAQGRFELDYWATSYRAAMDYVNGVAPANGKIFVAGPSYIAEIYARRDLKIYMDSDHELPDLRLRHHHNALCSGPNGFSGCAGGLYYRA